MQSTTWSGARTRVLAAACITVLFAFVLVLAAAAPARADSLDQPTLTISAAPTVVNWAQPWALSGELKASDSDAIPDAAVDLQASVDGGASWSTWQGVPWDAATSTYADSIQGTYQKMQFRLKYDGDGVTYAGAVSDPVTVNTRVKLGTPVAPSSVKKGSKFTAYGSLAPQQPKNSKTVKIKCYLKQNGKWVLKKSVSATNAKKGSNSRYSAAFSLSSKGSWKLVAYAPATALYAKTTSGADMVKVK